MKNIPKGSLYRLLKYLRTLEQMEQRGEALVSSEALGDISESTAAQVRRDLSFLGAFGTRGLGYDVAFLARQIRDHLGLSKKHAVALVGYGRLGSALLQYSGIREKGYQVAAIFDSDPSKVGTNFNGLEVQKVEDIPNLCRKNRIRMAVIATPALAAQGVAELLVSGGVQRILNFAPVQLRLGGGIIVRDVDLTLEFQFLSTE